MSSEMQLVEAIIGIGNPVHSHVRRNNEVNPNNAILDKLIFERMNGGVVPSTLNELSIMSGCMSSSPQGDILLSDGWNTKRGLAMLRFIVTTNSVQQEELGILGYLTGGDFSGEGVDSNTVFVPVRSWGVLINSRQDLETGLPFTQSTISDSQQFLLGTQEGLYSARPRDMINNVGIMSTYKSSGLDINAFCGETSQDMSTYGVVMSKTKNLDPTFCAREILGASVNAMSDALGAYATDDSLVTGLLESITRPGLNEIFPINNAFMSTMNNNLGSVSFAGFNGYTFGEINDVFVNLPEVLNVNMLNSTFADPDWLMMSSEYGSSGYAETIACEIAALTVNALTETGITAVEFVASNNVSEIGGLNSENGLAFQMGFATPLLQNEMNLPGRVEDFKDRLSRSFFARYNPTMRGGFSVSISAACYMFGETRVTVVINGKAESERTYANATYMINLTSPNISESTKSIDSARNMMLNMQEYLSLS